MESTVTCCRSALMCATIRVSELATPSDVLESELLASPLAPERVSEPSNRMFSAWKLPAGAAVADATLESSLTMALTLRDRMPESARALIDHSQPVTSRTTTATSATATRPAINSPRGAEWG
jgi:hypothetical protein